MKIRKGVFAVLFKKVGAYYHFAVLERVLHWNGWELNKGGLEEGEKYEDCIKREVEEETGIKNILSIKELDGVYSWIYTQDREKIKSEFVPFLVEVPQDAKINIANNPVKEHKRGFFLNYRDASGLLKYKEQKEVLKKAMDELEKK